MYTALTMYRNGGRLIVTFVWRKSGLHSETKIWMKWKMGGGLVRGCRCIFSSCVLNSCETVDQVVSEWGMLWCTCPWTLAEVRELRSRTCFSNFMLVQVYFFNLVFVWFHFPRIWCNCAAFFKICFILFFFVSTYMYITMFIYMKILNVQKFIYTSRVYRLIMYGVIIVIAFMKLVFFHILPPFFFYLFIVFRFLVLVIYFMTKLVSINYKKYVVRKSDCQLRHR